MRKEFLFLARLSEDGTLSLQIIDEASISGYDSLGIDIHIHDDIVPIGIILSKENIVNDMEHLWKVEDKLRSIVRRLKDLAHDEVLKHLNE